jgi:Protein of unknown function (DUF742)
VDDPKLPTWRPMPSNPHLDEDVEDSVVAPRTFVSLSRPTRVNDPSDNDESPAVRAFLVTSGRTTSSLVLEFESMVSVAPNKENDGSLRFERAQAFALCASFGAQSIAELSARLAIPIGVAKVIAGDLVQEGFLSVHAAQPNLSKDVAMLRRLIHGVRAL